MATEHLKYSEIIERIYKLLLELKQELMNLLENNIADERRTEIAKNIDLSIVEEKNGKLEYSTKTNQQKTTGFETIEIKQKRGIRGIIIPERLKIPEGKVYLKEVGNSLYMIPVNDPWKNMIDSLELFSPDFMNNRNQVENQQRESFDL